ncbi:MAG TPA: TetR/AcrR family transcriptional regulator [Polyangiaceae bacterium]|nr:TetR/AcrR family transcriptional regulator [Polyangiaceae bacterium]
MARPRTDIQPRIIVSARRCFARSGVDGSTLRQIAKGARTSIGMVYYYFPTKEDLFQAVVEDVYSNLLADLQAVLKGPATIEERIVRLYQRVGEASELELLTLRLVVREMLVSSELRVKLMERFKRGHLGLVQQALGEAVREGQVRTDVSKAVLLITTLAIGAVPQFMIKAMGNASPFIDAPQGEALARELLSVWLHGLAPQAQNNKSHQTRPS